MKLVRFTSLFLVCILLIDASAWAATSASPTVAIYKGTYMGNCDPRALDGTSLFYEIRLTLDKRGKIKGTAFKQDASTSTSSLAITGKLGKVKKFSEIQQTKSRGTMSFSDGARVKIDIARNDIAGLPKSAQLSIQSATIEIGNYLGTCQLLFIK